MKFMALKDFYLFVVIALIRVVSWVPSPALKELVARSIAFAAFHLSRRKRRLSEKNLAHAFGRGLAEHARRKIIKEAFYGFWRDTFSLLPSRAERTAMKRVPLRGIEHLRQALENGKGVILWVSNYFGRMALARQILHEHGFAIYKVHAEQYLGGFRNDGEPVTWVQQHIIGPFFEKCERPFTAGIIYLPNSDSLAYTRVLLERLKHNALVCAAGDGKFARRLIPVGFLGITDVFPTGMVSLARLSGASILPMFCVLERDTVCVVIEAPIRVSSDLDRERGLERSVTQYVRLLESYIQRYPDQYQNWNLLGKRPDQQEHPRSLETHRDAGV
jgi:lauroyl/myristoyl acyltransferase